MVNLLEKKDTSIFYYAPHHKEIKVAKVNKKPDAKLHSFGKIALKKLIEFYGLKCLSRRNQILFVISNTVYQAGFILCNGENHKVFSINKIGKYRAGGYFLIFYDKKWKSFNIVGWMPESEVQRVWIGKPIDQDLYPLENFKEVLKSNRFVPNF